MISAIPESAVRLSDRHFRTLAELIEGEVGIKLPPGKRLMLEGRLHKRVRALNYSGFDEYVEDLFEHGGLDTEFSHLIDVVTTNKTDFFREPSHFDFMKQVAVPELLRLRGRGSRPLKIWSAACSTGMEAYTAAYRPQSGDVVWDVGAHMGMSAYLLSKMVGPSGKVYAFEPDETNYKYLLLNIERHALSNVTPVKAALSGYTRIKFQADDLEASPAKELLQRVGSIGLPTYVVLRPK